MYVVHIGITTVFQINSLSSSRKRPQPIFTNFSVTKRATLENKLNWSLSLSWASKTPRHRANSVEFRLPSAGRTWHPKRSDLNSKQCYWFSSTPVVNPHSTNVTNTLHHREPPQTVWKILTHPVTLYRMRTQTQNQEKKLNQFITGSLCLTQGADDQACPRKGRKSRIRLLAYTQARVGVQCLPIKFARARSAPTSAGLIGYKPRSARANQAVFSARPDWDVRAAYIVALFWRRCSYHAT